MEKLQPAIDPDGTPANSEYPWQEGSSVVAPVDRGFDALLTQLTDSNGIKFLKLIRATFAELDDLAS